MQTKYLRLTKASLRGHILGVVEGGERGDGEGVGLHASISQSAAFIINWRSVLFTPSELFVL